ncbi:restriction endonuclease subunit S [Streptomyces viridosporus]|uniref:restriction endonuclease subunit S n=1 Tax=Streptomyces viridosporus TaxID=67581 RepID=UPI0033244F8A
MRTTDIADSRRLRDDTWKSLPPDIAGKALLRPGDLLMTAAGATIGKSYLHSGTDPACYAGYLVRFRANDQVDPRFVAYWTESRPYWDQISTGAVRSTIDNFSAGKYRNMTLSLPPLAEQRRIADFLDAQTARIDTLRGLRQRQLNLVREKLTARAAELTGRVRIREERGSAFTVQLRRALESTQTGLTPPSLHHMNDGGRTESQLPWYTPAALDEWLTLSPADKATSAAAGIPLFQGGSVLITGIGESLGKVAYLNHTATGNQQLTALKPARTVNAKFIAWQLWSAKSEIREWAQYSRIRIINNDTLKAFPTYLPSRRVQDSVAGALDVHLTRVRAVHAATEKFEQLAVERRQALITAAVTGQFDVSTASGRNVTEGISV